MQKLTQLSSSGVILQQPHLLLHMTSPHHGPFELQHASCPDPTVYGHAHDLGVQICTTYEQALQTSCEILSIQLTATLFWINADTSEDPHGGALEEIWERNREPDCLRPQSGTVYSACTL